MNRERIVINTRKKCLDAALLGILGAMSAQPAFAQSAAPAGSVETNGPQVFNRLDGAFDELQKIRDTPVVAQGRTLKLSDIATVKRGYEDPATFLIRNGGEPALLPRVTSTSARKFGSSGTPAAVLAPP